MSKWTRLTGLMAAVVLAGCVSTGGGGAATFTEGSKARALVVGLTAVDPGSYYGWKGECPGCDVDAAVMAMLCRQQGIETVVLTNGQATIRNVLNGALAAFEGLTAGDLAVFYISGHGGQIEDLSGDEDDRKDETLCLWDGQLDDDRLRTLWEKVPTGVRVFFVTDTCNSGTNYKARKLRRSLPREFKGRLVHFGGCADGMSSFGGASGGAFTTAMIDAWVSGITYRKWFDETRRRMGPGQIPIYGEYGASFEDVEALR